MSAAVDGETDGAGTEPSAAGGVRVETEAVVGGSVAAVVAGIVAVFLFAGRLTPLWAIDQASVGLVASAAVLVLGIAAGAIAYRRSRRSAGQEWRRSIGVWKSAVDIATVATVHAAIAAILTLAVFVLLQRSFEGLVVDGFIGTLAVVVSAGFAAYLIYSSASFVTTRKMSTLLVVFMAVATLASISAQQDPLWWEYHFSQLGTGDTFSATLFNGTLIVAGLFVTAFSLYLTRDLTTLAERGVLAHAWAPRFYGIVFVVLGLMLAGVGLFPLDVSIALHNGCAAGMAAAFALMVLGSPYILRGMPKRFFAFCFGVFALLIGGFLLYYPIEYWNLTAFELVAFGLIFGWITVFIRFVDALSRAGADVSAAPSASSAPSGQVMGAS